MGDPLIIGRDRLPISYEITEIDKIRNPFFERFGRFEDPYEEFVDICLNNLTFAVFNLMKWKGKPLELAPFQSVILQTLWDKTFPILLMTRGGGKSFMLAVYALLRATLIQGSKIVIVAASFRQSKVVFDYILKIYEGSPLIQAAVTNLTKQNDSWEMVIGESSIKALPLGNGEKIRGIRACVGADTLIDTEDGLIEIKELVTGQSTVSVFNGEKYVNPSHYVRTPVVDVHEVETMYGYKIHMSDIHRIETQDGWKDIDTIQENDRVAIYLNNKFTENYLISPTFSTDGETHSDYVIPKFIDEKLGRLLGYLVSEGNISSRSTISITSTEIEIINDYCKLFNECFGVTPQIYKKNAFTDKRGWKCKESYEAKICRLGIRNYLEAIGLKRQKAQNKEIPSSILKSPKSVVSEFLSGLFEGDGTVVKYKDARRGREQCYVAYYSVSEKLCRQLQTILLKFNLIGGIAVRKGSLSENNQYFLRFANRWASSFCQQISFVTQRKRQIANDCSQMFPIEKPVVKFIKVKSIKKAIRQDVLYDFCIPDGHAFIGNGFKNHNTDIICDEYASIPEEIFQVVVRGFAAVSADPIEAAKIIAIEDEKIRRGEMTEADRRRIIGNKIIYSGTASYRFNHFWKLYSIHKLIIDNKFVGDAKEISGAFKEDDGINLEGNLDYRDYAIIQVPYTAIPRGFMDEKQINQAYATMPKALFSMEYECMFPNDSDGFFKRSAINAATPGLEDDGTAFGVELSGDPNYEYVMGIDPARKTDNLAISIVKLMKDGTYRNVYCESMRNKNWVEAMYRIRALLKKFNIVRIAVDQGGGGTTIEDLLQRPELAQGGEPLIWRYNDVEHRRYEGLHILDMVNFTPTWIAEANYGMAADIEHKKLLFPYRNLEVDVDETTDPVWDEMEEQINEMCMITVTATKTGIQHFDLPEIQTESSINLVQRKDRYSALLLASYAARTYMVEGISSFSPEPGFWADYL